MADKEPIDPFWPQFQFTVAHFHRLNRKMRACALVGCFLQVWSLMEGSLNRVLGSALSLNITTTAILCTNMSLRDKVNLLRRVIHMSSLPDTEKTRANDIANQIDSYTEQYRNKMAHNLFLPSVNNDGVQFNVIRARGRVKNDEVLQFTELDLSVAQFGELYATVVDISNALEEIEEHLEPAI